MMNIPPKDEWQADRFIAASVSWTLFDWGVLRAKEAEAHARCLQARARLAQAEAAVAYEVRDARIRLQEALERTGVAERAEESARKSLKAVTDLWQGGLARHAEVLDAHTQLAESENQVLAARADAALAKAALEHATGATGVAGRQRQ
jgi:outer membrane protein TolC